MKFNRISYIFIQENAFENVVCETTEILSKQIWVKGHIFSSLNTEKRESSWRHCAVTGGTSGRTAAYAASIDDKLIISATGNDELVVKGSRVIAVISVSNE